MRSTAIQFVEGQAPGTWNPPAADTYDLGTTALEWRRLYLGDSADALQFGIAQDITMGRAASGVLGLAADLRLGAGKAIVSGATNGNTLLMKANDTTFITFTTGATDAMEIANATMSGTWLASGTVTFPALTFGGQVDMGAQTLNFTDAALVRAAANILTLASGDSFRIPADGTLEFGAAYGAWQPSVRRLPTTVDGNPSFIVNGDFKVIRSALASHLGSAVLSSGGARSDGGTADFALIEGNDADDWQELDWNWSLETILHTSGAELTGAVVGTFVLDETATGGTSGATGRVVAIGAGAIHVTRVVGLFVNGETVTGAGGATVSNITVTQQDTAANRSTGVIQLSRNYAPTKTWSIILDPNTNTLDIGSTLGLGFNGKGVLTSALANAGANRVTVYQAPTAQTAKTQAVLGLYGESSGDMAQGFGVAIDAYMKDTGAGPAFIGALSFEHDGADNRGRVLIYTNNAGSVLAAAQISYNGIGYLAGGLEVGAVSTNNLIDDASNGAGSTTLYIGNKSILVSNGVNFGPAAVTSITVVNGQITAIS